MEFEVKVNGVDVPLTKICTAVMSGTLEIGAVTVTEAVVPVWPEAWKLMFVEFAFKLVTVAEVVTDVVHPVPHDVVVV